VDQNAPGGSITGLVSHREKYLNLLQESLTRPLHKRLVGKYQQKTDPVKAMEEEFGIILLEILDNEN
jgi:5'-3' exonuclease